MIGLIVLALAGIYAWLIVLITRWAMRRASVPWKRTAIKFGLPAVLCIAPVADGIYGYLTLQYLCATEARTELLRPIRIPAEYFNSDGTPTFVTSRGQDIDWERAKPVLTMRTSSTKNYRARNLERVVREVATIPSGEIFARSMFFYFRGGWLQIADWKTWSDACFADPSITELVIREIRPMQLTASEPQ